jgi:heat shock protein HslJ
MTLIRWSVAIACMAVVVGCSSAVELLGTKWNVVTIGSRTVEEVGVIGLPTLKFDAEGNRVSGYAGCNRFSGGYSLKEQTLSFGQMAVTKMACEDSQNEDEILLALASIKRVTMDGKKLLLCGADGKPLLECLPSN